MYNALEIEKKWQNKWESAKIFEAEPDSSKAKIFITSPYPYASGTLHIGHGRSFVNGDIFARYYRAKGYNVLYPMAFHITGTPVLAISSSIKRKDKKIIARMKEYVSLHTEDPKKVREIVDNFTDPWNIVNYFSNTMKLDFKSIGMSIDWRREFTTGDKIYNKLIEWQFSKLAEKNYLEKGEYPILYCPRCMNAVGEDDIASGDELNLDINEFICIKFPFEDGYLVPATLRPETIYGVTNLWINPIGDYVKADVDGEIWFISKDATKKLEHQNKTVKVLETFIGEKLIGKKVKNLDNSKDLPILPGYFVDTDAATGVVYSVPAHAPFDYIALLDLQKSTELLEKFNLDKKEIQDIKPIQIIELNDFQDYPAKVYCKKFEVKSQADKEKLDKATAENYKVEFYNGILNKICGQYVNKPVSEAVNLVIEELLTNNQADKIYIPVTKSLKCRCGEKIIVTILKDQWFLNFDAGDWKENAFDCLSDMIIVPKKYRMNFENVFHWLKKRPCARKRGLGTKLPFDKDWIIESLSDSTIYMSFYTIVHHIKLNGIKPNQLIPEFFDFVYLKKGSINTIVKKTSIDEKLLKKMQEEFQYWYPVDHRHTAIMHISNHLSFYIFHHVAIFPRHYWPKVITLIEPVLIEGQKMGKSKGNIISLGDIKTKYSADLFRFYISHTADLGINMDWREKEIQAVRNHIARFYEFMHLHIENVKNFDYHYKDIQSKYACVILSKISQNFLDADDALKNFNLRKYLQLSFYEAFNLIQDLQKHVEDYNDFEIVFSIIYREWLKIISLTMPHLSEELWEISGSQGFVSKSVWGQLDSRFIDKELEIEFNYVSNLIDDILNIKKLVKARNTEIIYIYTAIDWKYSVNNLIINKKGDFNAVITELKKEPDLMKIKELIPFIKHQISKRSWNTSIPKLHEKQLLNEYKGYIENRTNSKIIIDSDIDPQNKVSKAIPFKPAIYIDIN
ncbi:MAG: leucine--tRNA ligase [Promethearchaeota archaeon]